MRPRYVLAPAAASLLGAACVVAGRFWSSDWLTAVAFAAVWSAATLTVVLAALLLNAIMGDE